MSRVIDFQLITEIEPDGMRYNWHTGEYDKIESLTSQRYFAEQLYGLTASDTVNLYINSMGGSVKEALGIYNLLKRCPATVTAYIDGFAASAASVIAMAADKVVMPRNTCMMIHNAAWWTYGNPAALRKSADDLEVINTSVINSYVMRAGDKLPEEELTKLMDEETWLTAESCLTYGLADEYGSEDADLTKAAQAFQAAAKGGGVAYAKAPAFLGAVRLPAAEAAPKESNPQAGAPENNTGSLGDLLLKSLFLMED